MTKKHKENLQENLDENFNDEKIDIEDAKESEDIKEDELDKIIEDTTQELKLNEYKDDLIRLQAEFENYRKRNENLVEKSKTDGIIFAINKLLPVLDSFKSAKQKIFDEDFLNSLNLIEKQFYTGLENLKITKIEAEGQIFDPNFHNAVLTGSDESKPDDEILEVFQDGFKLNDRIIRHSVVKINKLNS